MHTLISTCDKPKRNRPRSPSVKLGTSDKSKRVRRGINAKSLEPEHLVKPEGNGMPRTVLAQEILENLRKFPHSLLLTRVGQFYEVKYPKMNLSYKQAKGNQKSYFDQAVDIARLLNIKLTTRKWGGGRVPMCGFPLSHLDKHLKILVQQNKRSVAMCEEFPRHSENIKTFERRVTRIITPGTLIDEAFLNPFENNYLLAIGISKSIDSVSKTTPLGLAWIDISTGEFYSRSATLDDLQDELARIDPREVVLDRDLQRETFHPIHEALAEDDNFVSFTSPTQASEGNCPIQRIIPSIPSQCPEETSAIALLTCYLNANLLDHMPTLSVPHNESTDCRMEIDSHTIKALEIREGFREGGTKGSLFNTIKRTVTSGGSRLLSRWLCTLLILRVSYCWLIRDLDMTGSPSTSIIEIQARQALVAFFHSRPTFRSDLHKTLTETEDTGRIVQKFMLSRGDPTDLLAVKRTTDIWSKFQRSVEEESKLEAVENADYKEEEWASLHTLLRQMAKLDELSKRIGVALDNRFSSPDDLPGVEIGGEDLGVPQTTESNMTWKYGPTKWMINPSWKTMTLIFKEWARLGSQIADITQALVVAEKEVFDLLRSEVCRGLSKMVNSHSQSLRHNARILDELDIILSFAKLASELNFVRPTLTDEPLSAITNGRHPSVEIGLLATGRVFTPNSVLLSPASRVHVITGPNMAGKSTFLRQTALITILAQVGSFVPADSATLGIVDKLFSRVGAKDDLFHDRSTFMVEMLETAEILRRATSKSLVREPFVFKHIVTDLT
ncbi:hypothetical protein H0H81_003518 [Sphagnurus paluster]|uniref:DNA mismatch repair proteins mutS family domain-containing protein n=1 Tax=Sphagnurus paluster TaxID=117069 RepID=A0A9P7K7Q1_9AGAR|nr:hypothetical protein H0H81_003518 [Sphagnurus paluster]